MDKDELQDVYKMNFKRCFKKGFDCETVSKEKYIKKNFMKDNILKDPDDPDNILKDKKSHENVLVYTISYKTLLNVCVLDSIKWMMY